MSWAEEKTLEQFIEANSYDPSKASVIGLFPRNMVLKRIGFSTGGAASLFGHGFLFKIRSTIKIQPSIASSDPSGTINLTCSVDDAEPLSMSTSVSGLSGNTSLRSSTVEGPSFNTELLYIDTDLSVGTNHLEQLILNGPIEFKERLIISHTVTSGGYLANARGNTEFFYILVDNGGGA